jgi:nitrite reductase (NADH) small subunit
MEVVLGGRRLALCNVSGHIYAISGVCPHLGAPLAYGNLAGRMLACPWHAWEFDCSTGEYDRNPLLRLDRFEVKVEDGWVLVGCEPDRGEPEGSP